MAGLKRKRRIQLLAIAIVLVTAASVLIGYGFRDGINYFRPPSEVVENPPPSDEMFRIGGLVKENSIRETGSGIAFIVTDGGAEVEVHFSGLLPDLFAENQGMIALGQLQEGVFVASEVLAKHDEQYMPKEVADALKEQGVYKGDDASSDY